MDVLTHLPVMTDHTAVRGPELLPPVWLRLGPAAAQHQRAREHGGRASPRARWLDHRRSDAGRRYRHQRHLQRRCDSRATMRLKLTRKIDPYLGLFEVYSLRDSFKRIVVCGRCRQRNPSIHQFHHV